MSRKKMLAGNKYGRLTVIKDAKQDRFGHILWECLCECGKKCVVAGYSLESGNTKSCGCLSNENRTKHGMHESAEYSTWESMIQRCTNEKAHAYKHYGGRGIVVCERWKDFKNFFEDMGEKPNKSFSIERRDNNKGYYPENCYWATKTIQSRNTRKPKGNSTGVKGVFLNKKPGKKYRAAIAVKRKYIHLGHFDTIVEAAEARRQGEIKYWGENYA